MNELWMWEYKGKTEWGKIEEPQKCDCPLIILDCKPDKYGVTTYRRDRSHVTNLRPAKVVDAEAVVIEGIGEIFGLGLQGNIKHLKGYAEVTLTLDEKTARSVFDQLEQVIKPLTPPEPKKTLLMREQRRTIYFSDNGEIRAKFGDCYCQLGESNWQKEWEKVGLSPYAEDWQHILNPKVEAKAKKNELSAWLALQDVLGLIDKHVVVTSAMVRQAISNRLEGE